jgi:hypothetical protein
MKEFCEQHSLKMLRNSTEQNMIRRNDIRHDKNARTGTHIDVKENMLASQCASKKGLQHVPLLHRFVPWSSALCCVLTGATAAQFVSEHAW